MISGEEENWKDSASLLSRLAVIPRGQTPLTAGDGGGKGGKRKEVGGDCFYPFIRPDRFPSRQGTREGRKTILKGTMTICISVRRFYDGLGRDIDLPRLTAEDGREKWNKGRQASHVRTLSSRLTGTLQHRKM